jgi:hypothetical protein
MTTLTMTIPSAATTKYVSVEDLKSKFGNTKGHTSCEIEWNDSDNANNPNNPIVVTVNCTTFINKTLAGKQKQDVEAHERRHFADFMDLAKKMKKDIEGALNGGKNPQIATRVEWFKYDGCVRGNALHREGDGYGTDMCFKPDSARP